ncbi:two-component regulator propeller domain-containing protein [Chitinophaga sp. sic0106]|uniref:hybrid sensor histidine kinase/response regulator transcription factor n=1 Tax=Chitinophaga sp. sic0106 TaxID=2854785 RepID=UPI001C464E49|nr:two-component regulator propeller domain-containing protein [Chitinophaga sp. sic0106]MBV7531479.1 response regulator [Chitinophaga sp. sic0106]
MRKWTSVIFLLVSIIGIFLHAAALRAQTLHYQFSHIDNNDGLLNNQVNCIYKDSSGFMWIGTVSGLNRYDGYNFRSFQHDARDTTTLSDNTIEKIQPGPGNTLWLFTRNGIDLYHPATNKFDHHPERLLQQLGIHTSTISDVIRDKERYIFLKDSNGIYLTQTGKPTIHLLPATQQPASIATASVADLVADHKGHYWIIHSNGILEMLDATTGKVLHRNTTLQQQNGGGYTLCMDADGDLWTYGDKEDNGVWYYETAADKWTHISQTSPGISLNNNIVRGIVPGNPGEVWIGTDHGGINVINKSKKTVQYIENIADDRRSLSQNSITTLYRDNSGIIWIGTFKKGLNYYHENMVKFPLFQYQAYNRNSLPFDDVNRFVQDAKGNLWIGTNGGGLIYYDRSNNTFKQYKHDPANPASISGNVVVSLLIDHQGQLWAGTYFGGLDRFTGNGFVHYKHNPADSTTISDNSVWELMEDHQHQLWVGTLNGGVNLFNPATGQFRRMNKIFTSRYVSALLQDHNGQVWVGSSEGLTAYNPATRATTKFNSSNKAGSLPHNNIVCLFEDSHKRLWTGTRDGLSLYDPAKNTFRNFRKEDGLPSNTVLNILEDDHSGLWMSTPNGLSNLQEKSGAFTFKNYDESDGLQGKEFNENAALRTSKGELIFGGGNGFNLFYPDQIILNRNLPPVVLTDFQVFNQRIEPGQQLQGRTILTVAIPLTQSVTLRHNQNIFSIEFAALNYFHPEKNRYAYMLEGFNNNWLYTDGTQRKATFTNLDPGEYTFRVKASNNDGIWNDTGATLHIRILPPFWKTWPAFLLYALLIIGALVLARRIILERERLKFSVAQQIREAERMHELDSLKIRFFTNVSHEFRTPLSLIITPLERLISTGNDKQLNGQLQLMQRNARRLLNLVNQLLDFRKLEVEQIKLHTTPGDLAAFVKELTHGFSDLSEKKHIQLDFHSNVQSLPMAYDADKMEKIIFNLLSNAFKFTPDYGKIAVELQYDAQESQVQILIKDNGIGIPLEQQAHIFERFFQHDVAGAVMNQGSGIGLSITREFVKLHGGTIVVDSAPEMGSCFTVSLPVQSAAAIAGTVSSQVRTLPEAAPASPQTNQKDLPKILLVEDNEDFRFYLKDNLSQYYHVEEAENGLAAWKLLQTYQPQLIVSDIAMPHLDGLELCKKVRASAKTNHLPIILLTARAEEAQQLEALETGATDYVTKPFNFEMLLSKIRNIVQQQQSLRKTFRQHFDAHPSEIEISSADEQFIQQAIGIVEQNISNPDFSVEELSRALFMSRVSAYKKILSITGKSPIEFIRSIRLKRAAQLLEKSQLTVAEVAYEVGFNNPKYFTKYFKMEFNELPSVYSRKK